MEEVFGYSRISEEDRNKPKDEVDSSIKNQDELITKYCKENNKKLIKIYTDRNLSGSDRFRKDFTEMIIKTIENPNIKGIITKDGSRFCRDSSFFRDTLIDLRAYNKYVISILDNKKLDPDDIADKIISVTNEIPILLGKKNAINLFQQKQDKSLPCITAPFGYRYDKKGGNWVQNKEAEKVKQFFQMQGKKTYKEISQILDISISMCYKLAKNKKIYEGYVIYYKKIRDKNNQIIREEKVEYKGTFEPILTQD